jgi:hypothetical protein
MVIVLVKRVDWSMALIALGGAVLVAGLVDVFRSLDLLNKGVMTKWIVLCVLWIMWTCLAVTAHTTDYRGPVKAWSEDRPIVCLGNSLSSGENPGTGYAPFLQARLSVPVIDLSEPGITTRDALKQLPTVLEAHPQAVVIELGGNDYLKGYGRQSTLSDDGLHPNLRGSKLLADYVLRALSRMFGSDRVNPVAGER